MLYPVVMMTIQYGSNDVWTDAPIAQLIARTGFEPAFDGLDMWSLYEHAADCYPRQDWRLLCDGTPINHFFADDVVS